MWSHGSIADSRPGQLCSSAYGALPVGRDLSVPTDEASFTRLFSFQHIKIFSATGAAAVSH